jgi:hypothetical protein
MDYELRIIVEKVAVSSQEVVKRDTIKIYDIQRPESIIDLGLRHAEQISLLEKIQNAVLAEQSVLNESSPQQAAGYQEENLILMRNHGFSNSSL